MGQQVVTAPAQVDKASRAGDSTCPDHPEQGTWGKAEYWSVIVQGDSGAGVKKEASVWSGHTLILVHTPALVRNVRPRDHNLCGDTGRAADPGCGLGLRGERTEPGAGGSAHLAVTAGPAAGSARGGACRGAGPRRGPSSRAERGRPGLKRLAEAGAVDSAVARGGVAHVAPAILPRVPSAPFPPASRGPATAPSVSAHPWRA
ncbi:unnamed protein product [Rangifer tarandus platyrhynchus]|uniref:Uncharacterized protein n=1 Tax=Rangifer tarandus platyrhynchus TaxID=3082113 RepID=A0AC59ZDK3_RANTA